jgi:YaiO family outer membrane protein
VEPQINPTDMVRAARELAFHGHRDEALELLDKRLAERPTDSDALVLRGTILSWEGRYDEARNTLEGVLAQHPGHGDALPALINVEMWSDHPDRAEKLAREALRNDPNDSGLLLSQAKALRSLNRTREALQVIRHLLLIDPGNQNAVQMEQSMGDSLRRWTASIDHSSEWFSDGRTPWQEEQVQLSRQTSAGSLIARFDHANRFGDTSQQVEIDAYPHIRPGMYAYLNLGYSPDAMLYPRFRVGADLYQSLGHGFEATAGFREMHFGSDVHIYTAAVTKYRGNWMLTSRMYLTPDIVGTSRSVQVQARHYGSSVDNYFGVRFGYGSSPTEVTYLTDIQILDATSASVDFQRALGRHMRWSGRFGVSREDRVGSSGLMHYLANTSLDYRF